MAWEWRNQHTQAVDVQKELSLLEREYRTTLSKLKKQKELQKRLQADIDQMTASNAQLEQIIREKEGSNVMIQQYANIDHQEYAAAEELEELYLQRIDELQEQIRSWNEKMLYREYIARNRFPHFHITCRILSSNNTKKQQSADDDVLFKIRLPFIQAFPVEISSLSQMVKQQDVNGIQKRFRKVKDSESSSPLLRLEQLTKPGGVLPEWPFKHHVAVNQQGDGGTWYVITEPARSSLLLPQQEQQLQEQQKGNNFGLIMMGEDFLERFMDDSSQDVLSLQVLAAERVVW